MTRDPIADIDIATWIRAHQLEVLVAVTRHVGVEAARELAELLGADLAAMEAALAAEIERRQQVS